MENEKAAAIDYPGLLAAVTDMSDALDNLEHYVDKRLSYRSVDQQLFKFNRFKWLNMVLNKYFRNNSAMCSLAYSAMLMLVLEVCEALNFQHFSLLCVLLIGTTAVLLVFLLIATLEQVRFIIRRAARLQNIFCLYVALLFLFADVYCLLEVAFPGSFLGMKYDSFHKTTVILQIFGCCVYMSSLSLSSVGFGDISPLYLFGRMVLFCENSLSFVLLTILFGNFIQ